MHKTNGYVKLFFIVFCAYCVLDVVLILVNTVPYFIDGSMASSSVGTLVRGYFLNHIAPLLMFSSILIKNKSVGIVGAIMGLLKSIYEIINLIMKPYTPWIFVIFGIDTYRSPSIIEILSKVGYLIVFLLILIMMLSEKKGKTIGVISAAILGLSNISLMIYKYGFGVIRLVTIMQILLRISLYFFFAFAWENLFKNKESVE